MTTRVTVRNPVPGVGVSARTSQFLARVYADKPAKVLAFDLKVSESTAKALLRGQYVDPHIEQLASLYGAPFLRFIFQDATARAASSAERLDRIEQEITAIEAELRGPDGAANFQEAREADTHAHLAGHSAAVRGDHAGLSRAAVSNRGERCVRLRRPGPLPRGLGQALAAHPRWAGAVRPLIREILAAGA